MDSAMNFCEHCQGQRFDRAQVIRALRRVRKDLQGRRRGRNVDEALALALKAVATLEIPHLDIEGEGEGGGTVH